MKKKFTHVCLYVLCSLSSLRTIAQLDLSGQLRTRAEFRNGQGSPLPESASPALFISQRTRLNLSFSAYRLKLYLSAQDVRVWGQDVSTINRTTTQDNNGFMLHEAWAEILLSDTSTKNQSLSLKIGRQELVYDDQRLLGNLDWLQQGRSNDAAILKYEMGPWMLHLAAAYNQNKENASGTIYNSTPPGNYTATTNGGAMYKSMQFLYVGRKLKQGNASFLFFTDQFSKFHMDTVSSTPVKTFQTGSWARFTTGLYLTNTFNKISITASSYYQFGKTATGQNLQAALLTGSVQYGFSKKFSAGPGIDYTTGGTTNGTSNAFDPLYGTPHKFWGLMDYFYAASPFGKGGLTDYYFKTKFKPSEKLLLSADFHQFSSASKLVVPANPTSNSRSLGQELDMVGTYTITKQVGVEAGYGHFFTTSLLASAPVKNVANVKPGADWAYIMITIKPDFHLK